MLAPLRLCQLARPAKSEPLAAFLFFDSFGSIGVALRAMQKQFAASLSEIQWNADRDRDLIQFVILFRQTRRQFRTAPALQSGCSSVCCGPRLWTDGALFAGAQQFAFACLVPVELLAVVVAFQSRHGSTMKASF
jgi:hypothetical protein